MKTKIIHCHLVFFLWWFLGFGSLLGCEETLDVCAPCASVENGDVTISGDPRIDSAIDAVQRIRHFALRAEAAFERDRQQLAAAFGVDSNASITELKDSIRAALWLPQVVEIEIHRQRASCWTDMEIADRAELNCEYKLACNVPVSAKPGMRNPDCEGWFMGQCDGTCDGSCFVKSEIDAICETECVGTCINDAPAFCPGKCHGICSESCDSYSEEGECAGYCQGTCSGICASITGFPCNGTCYGRCGSPMMGGECNGGECYGTCTKTKGSDGSLGVCRGNVVYKEYDPKCSDCVETAETLAWSRVYCEPAKVQIALRFLPDALFSDVDKTAIVHKATVLENVLSRMATDQAKLGLLLDGVDDAGEMTAESLVPVYGNEEPEYLAEADKYAVAEERKHLPLDKLKARLGFMTEFATSGKFKLAVGILPCVTPALKEAVAILEQMVPVLEANGRKEADRSCGEADATNLAPCLFSLRDEQLVLLSISEEQEK